jgi:hypothetical protein
MRERGEPSTMTMTMTMTMTGSYTSDAFTELFGGRRGRGRTGARRTEHAVHSWQTRRGDRR